MQFLTSLANFQARTRSLYTSFRPPQALRLLFLTKATVRRNSTAQGYPKFSAIIEISAEFGKEDAITELTDTVSSLFTDEKISVGNEAIISSARHNASLTRTLELVNSAITAYRTGFSADAASSDAERALGAIAELDGRAVSEEVVKDIFAKFCVGK